MRDRRTYSCELRREAVRLKQREAGSLRYASAVIASYAANHYSVQKTAREDRTTVNVNLLTEQERVGELTRMLGGTLDETVTLEHARELLRRAR